MDIANREIHLRRNRSKEREEFREQSPLSLLPPSCENINCPSLSSREGDFFFPLSRSYLWDGGRKEGGIREREREEGETNARSRRRKRREREREGL